MPRFAGAQKNWKQKNQCSVSLCKQNPSVSHCSQFSCGFQLFSLFVCLVAKALKRIIFGVDAWTFQYQKGQQSPMFDHFGKFWILQLYANQINIPAHSWDVRKEANMFSCSVFLLLFAGHKLFRQNWQKLIPLKFEMLNSMVCAITPCLEGFFSLVRSAPKSSEATGRPLLMTETLKTKPNVKTFALWPGHTKAPSTQDAGRDAHANWNVFPLMLLECSVDTPIHINRSHLLASRCASRPASCVDWAQNCVRVSDYLCISQNGSWLCVCWHWRALSVVTHIGKKKHQTLFAT